VRPDPRANGVSESKPPPTSAHPDDNRLAGITRDADAAVERSLTGTWQPAVREGWFGAYQPEVFVRIGELL
jgi:hypothetical protein